MRRHVAGATFGGFLGVALFTIPSNSGSPGPPTSREPPRSLESCKPRDGHGCEISSP
jgi:hypothetical protein